MKKLSKKKKFIFDYRYILGLCTGLIIAGTSAYAITVASNTVTYDNTNSGLTSTNVQSAIDELYAKSNKLKATVGLYRNSNIVSVKKYDQTENSPTLCITGNENTCEELAPTTSTTYNQGTIVDYKVNSTATRRFHVLHDDGDKLTLQDQKNIVDNVEYATKEDYIAAGGTESEWNSCTYNGNIVGCNNKGPVTILPALESATNSWTNVNLQTYTLGTTSFLGNNKTGCTDSACSENKYAMEERNARARIITVPEAWNTRCQTWNAKTCPKYMYNYIMNADNFDGITDGSELTNGYWTMNARSDYTTIAWIVYCIGGVGDGLVGDAGHGARAVVVVNK